MNIKPLNPDQQAAAVAAFQREHGARVRRAEAMRLLDIADERTFNKVVDATPHLRHRLPGESQDKYVTSVIYFLRPDISRCATSGEEKKRNA